MKKLLLVLVCLNPSVLSAGERTRVVQDLATPHGGLNDLNGDGGFDLADMVCGLNFLFLGGDPPAPTVLHDDVVDELPAVVDLRSLLAACEKALLGSQDRVTALEELVAELEGQVAHLGQELAEARGPCVAGVRFVDNGDGTVTDCQTGLEWQQETAPRHMTWYEAGTYCEDLELAGETNWRLPIQEELRSLLNGDLDPEIDPIFVVSDNNAYWTATTLRTNPAVAHIVDFDPGDPNGIGQKDGVNLQVRAVRCDARPVTTEPINGP